jgi:hypothetical protein
MDPNDIRDYWFDWGSDALDPLERFLPDSVDIASSTVTVSAGITKVSDAIEADNKRVRVRLSNPVSTGAYDVTNLITVSTGEQFEDTKTLTVKERTS